ncbi:DEAD/DEAH box helicase [Bacillus sp. JJ634]
MDFYIEFKKKESYYFVHFSEYNKECVDMAKETPKRWYDGENKQWRIPEEHGFSLYQKYIKKEYEVKGDIPTPFKPKKTKKSTKTKRKTIHLSYPHATRPPFPHQLEATLFLLEHEKALLSDEMGLGKTTSSILAAEQIQGIKLVLCPATLKLNWQKEILLINPHASIFIPKKVEELYQVTDGYLIVNYDILWKMSGVLSEMKLSCIILDEAHYIKAVNNGGKPTSKRAEAVFNIAEGIPYLFALTGTPIPNKTKDIYNILRLIGHPLGKGSFFGFAQRYCGASHNGYGWDFEGSSHQKELHEKLNTHMIRRYKNQVTDLPAKLRNYVDIEIKKKEYEQLVNHFLTNQSKLKAADQLVQLNRMKQAIAYNKTEHSMALAEDILSENEPLVVFSNYEEVIQKFQEKFPFAVRLTGKENGEKKQKAIDDFQSGKTNLIVCNVKAGGVGVTLTRAKVMLMNDIDWTAANMVQAEDRIHRIGQEESVVIHYMRAKNIDMEEWLFEIIEEKFQNSAAVVDGVDVEFKDEESVVQKIKEKFKAMKPKRRNKK